jgi:hydrogenase maturation protease
LKNAVIGIGNVLRADDGVGIHVVQRLEDEIPGCEAVDMATAGIDLLQQIRGREKVVIVDAIVTGSEPGTIHWISNHEIRSPAFEKTHSLNLYGTIMLGQLLYPEEMPEKLVILGVEAWDVDSFKTELSPRVEQAIPEIIGAIKLEFGD